MCLYVLDTATRQYTSLLLSCSLIYIFPVCPLQLQQTTSKMALRLFTRTMPRRVGLLGRSQQPRRSVMLSSKEEEVSEADRTIAKPEVERFISDCMTTVGTEEGRAKMLAANLTEADYRGNSRFLLDQTFSDTYGRNLTFQKFLSFEYLQES